MNLKTRIEKLEQEMEPHEEETIVCIRNFSKEAIKRLPDPQKEVERQRAEGKRLIVVEIPDGYKFPDER